MQSIPCKRYERSTFESKMKHLHKCFRVDYYSSLDSTVKPPMGTPCRSYWYMHVSPSTHSIMITNPKCRTYISKQIENNRGCSSQACTTCKYPELELDYLCMYTICCIYALYIFPMYMNSMLYISCIYSRVGLVRLANTLPQNSSGPELIMNTLYMFPMYMHSMLYTIYPVYIPESGLARRANVVLDLNLSWIPFYMHYMLYIPCIYLIVPYISIIAYNISTACSYSITASRS